LRADRKPAANAFTFRETSEGYAQLRQAFERLEQMYGRVHFQVRIDAAGQYAANLESFLRSLPQEKTISVGQPKQNRDYCKAHFPKRKADAVDAEACARFAIVEQPQATPEVPAAFAQLRDVCSAVESQANQTTRLINQLHNRLARIFPELAIEASHLSAKWLLRVLAKYPTPARIAAARLESLTSLPHVSQEKAERLQDLARRTVASQRGPVAEDLIRHSVAELRRGLQTMDRLKGLLEDAFDALPEGPHRQILTIPGIGKQTAAALVAKMVRIDRFARPESVINYFGVFPEEYSSGVDKRGRPIPPGTMRMSPKGNDLVRRSLWNAAKSAILHNPPVRALYARQKAKGKRGDVALGHCMRKLLQQVFATWTTDRPFTTPEPATGTAAATRVAENENAEGRTRQSPERQAVTSALSNIASAAQTSNAPEPEQTSPTASDRVDFAQLRSQISIEQVLRELHWWNRMSGHGSQRRGPCPLHEPSPAGSRCFSVNLSKNIFHCFEATCGAQGNVLDLWAQVQRVTIPRAAYDLARRLKITPAQRRGTRQQPVEPPTTPGAAP
jgi:transposase